MSATLVTVGELIDKLSVFPMNQPVVVAFGTWDEGDWSVEGMLDGPDVYEMALDEVRSGFNPARPNCFGSEPRPVVVISYFDPEALTKAFTDHDREAQKRREIKVTT